ncbi:hypothetical protein [Luteimonas sp. TWI1416]|uniref:hypothetical protein n=1 Tax=unclassified Luteimonas TaxID=2629088 RepID=UPI00320963C2
MSYAQIMSVVGELWSVMLRNFFVGATWILASAFAVPQVAAGEAEVDPNARMHQCEDCHTLDQVRGVGMSLARMRCGVAETHVFSLKHRFIQRVQAGAGGYCGPTPNPYVGFPENDPAIEEAFAYMLEAEGHTPQIFRMQQVIIGDIGGIGGLHNPVEVAVGGRHGQAYGGFQQAMKSCFSDAVCLRRIHPGLASIAGANSALRGVNISIIGSGAGVNWENDPPTHDVWLCNANQDCALVKFRNGEWTFVESRAEGGRGIRYPEPDENLDYRIDNPESFERVRRGFQSAGFSFVGGWGLRSITTCVTVAGSRTCTTRTM